MKLHFFFFIVSLNSIYCHEPAKILDKIIPLSVNSFIEEVIAGLSLEEKIGQLFMSYAPLENFSLQLPYPPGAVFLHGFNIPPKDFKEGFQEGSKQNFKKNIRSKEKAMLFAGDQKTSVPQNHQLLKKNLQDIQREFLSKKLPLPFVAIDQEGGYVRRLRGDFFEMPSALSISQSATLQEAYQLSYKNCQSLRELGIDWNLAPVADTLSNLDNAAIRTRAWGRDYATVEQFVNINLQASREAQCLSTLKHFPGHGSSITDSHQELPQVKISLSQLKQSHLLPFTKNLRLTDSIMPAHIKFSSIDDNVVTTSKFWLQNFLRNKLHFTGILLSDAVMMKALTGEITDKTAYRKVAAQKTLESFDAGMDMFIIFDSQMLLPNEVFSLFQKSFPNNPTRLRRLHQSLKRILMAKLRYGKLNHLLENYSQKEKVASFLKHRSLQKIMKNENRENDKDPQNIFDEQNIPAILKKIAEDSIVTINRTDINLNDFHNCALFTDVAPQDKIYKLVAKRCKTIHSLQRLTEENNDFKIPSEANIIVLQNNFMVKESGEVYPILKILKTKYLKNRTIVYTMAHPIPLSKIHELAQNNIAVIASLSQTLLSQQTLINTMLKRQWPKLWP